MTPPVVVLSVPMLLSVLMVSSMLSVSMLSVVSVFPGVTVGASSSRVPRGDGEHVPDVPAGMVVGEDRLPEARRRPARGAVCAQHPGGGEDRVRGVVRGERAGRVGSDGVFGEGGGLELHRPLGALAVPALVDAACRGPAIVRFHRPDPREHLPGKPRTGPGRVPVPGQVARRDARQAGRADRAG